MAVAVVVEMAMVMIHTASKQALALVAYVMMMLTVGSVSSVVAHPYAIISNCYCLASFFLI